jgi:hypothetical protein
MIEFDLSITPTKYSYSNFDYLHSKSNRIIGFAISSTKGVVLLRILPSICKCPKQTIEKVIIHETLHHVVREVSGEKAFYNLDNLCYEKRDVCSLACGMGLGITLEKFK